MGIYEIEIITASWFNQIMLGKSTFLSVLILTISSNLPRILLWTKNSFFVGKDTCRDQRGVWNRSYWGPHYPLRFSQFWRFVIVGSDRSQPILGKHRGRCQALCLDQSRVCNLRSRVGLMLDQGIYVYMLTTSAKMDWIEHS